MRRLISKFATFLRLPLREKLLFLPVWLMLGMARAAVLTIAFRRIAPVFGHDARGRAMIPLLDPEATARARRIGRLVRLAARYCPWNANCLAQAMTAAILLDLARIPHAMFFGTRRDRDGSFKAHAWVAAGRASVTGGRSFGAYGVVGVFVAPADLLAEPKTVAA